MRNGGDRMNDDKRIEFVAEVLEIIAHFQEGFNTNLHCHELAEAIMDKLHTELKRSNIEARDKTIKMLEELVYKTNKDMQMDDAVTLYPLVIKRLNFIIKELRRRLTS